MRRRPSAEPVCLILRGELDREDAGELVEEVAGAVRVHKVLEITGLLETFGTAAPPALSRARVGP